MSRNRLSESAFLALKIQMPTTQEGLQRIVDILARAAALRARQRELEALTNTWRDEVVLMLPGPD